MHRVKKTLLLFLFILIWAQSDAQTLRSISGTIQDTTGSPLPGTVVKIKAGTDSLSTSADANGTFRFRAVKSGAFTLTAAFIGFQTYIKQYNLENSDKQVKLPPIQLKVSVNELDEVVITGITPVKVKEDTIEYDARAFKVREGEAAEEMVKKLPGVAVDKNGNITAQGKPITRVRVNGKDFFGGDVQTATQNLPADIIQNLQIIDDYGDQANLTGIKTDEPEKILNINTQPGKKKGYFGRATLAGGNNERYIGRINANNFKDEQQISLLGSLNNTNANIFRRGDDDGDNGSDGITNTKSIGLNYRDEWSEKIESNGSYSFSNRVNNTIGTSLRQNIYQDFTRFDNSSTNNNNNNINHRFSWETEFNIDSSNYIEISPEISYNTSQTENSGLTLTNLLNTSSVRNNNSATRTATPDIELDLLYNHKFSKQGRNFSLNAEIDFSDRDQDRNLQNNYTNTDSAGNVTLQNQYQFIGIDNKSTRTSMRLSYREPIGKLSFLEMNYDWRKTYTESIRDTRDIDLVSGEQTSNPLLSNNFKYQFTTNRFGLNYRFIEEKYNYTLGLVAQPVLLEGQNISRNINTSNRTFNLIPTARFVYRLSRKHSFSANYGGSSNQPSFNQLQPIVDNSNLQNTIIGNPDLKPEFNNRLRLEYNQTDWEKGHNVFTNLSFNQTQNKIVTSNVTFPDSIKQETRYLNTDGFYNLSGYYSYSKPFADRKYTLTYDGGANYSNNVAFTNNERNLGKNTVINQGLKFRVDLEDIIDAELGTSYSINRTKYTQASFANRNANRLIIGLSGKNFFLKDWTLGYDFSQTINNGYSNTNNPNPTLLNVFVERRFMKKMATVRFQGFDLFNENTGISRDVFDNVIVDSQNNRLARYFLFSFNLRLQKFAGGVRPERSGMGRRDGGREE